MRGDERVGVAPRLPKDADLDAANGWERVVKLIDCDTKPEKDGRSDLSRMRSILVQLKNEPLE